MNALGIRHDLSQAAPGERVDMPPPALPGLAFGQGFEIVQLSDQSKDTPSILLNSGEDECDSCLGLTFPVGSDPLPGWALFPRGHLLSLISPQGCY